MNGKTIDAQLISIFNSAIICNDYTVRSLITQHLDNQTLPSSSVAGSADVKKTSAYVHHLLMYCITMYNQFNNKLLLL